MCSYHCAQYTTQHSSDNLLLSSRQLMFIIAQVLSVEGSGVWKIIIRVTTCMENLKMSGYFDICQWNVRDFTKSQGKNFVRENWPKTIVSCIFICLFLKQSWLCWVCALHFGLGSCTVAFLPPLLTKKLVPAWYEQHFTWAGVPRTVREMSWNCQGILHRLESVHNRSVLTWV